MEPKHNIQKLIDEKGVQFRDFKLKNMEVRQNEDGTESMTIDGVACTFNDEVVLYKGKYYECREKIADTALDGADMSNVIFNYNHCGRVYARTRNNSLKLTIANDGLHVKAELMSGDEGHAQLFRDIKTGLIDKMSFAFTVKESSYEYIEVRDRKSTRLNSSHIQNSLMLSPA